MYAQKLSFDYAHTLHTMRIVHNAHSVHRSQVQKGQSCDGINFVRVTDLACGSGDFSVRVFFENGYMCTHFNIHGFFMLFPYESVLLGVSFTFDFTNGNEHGFIVLVFLFNLRQKIQHPLTLYL